ncbi:hypothetical protein FXO37_00923 [Capsicum annuum]|nr:hypothetical protein FXO37_00923 [Capsicum annuum]
MTTIEENMSNIFKRMGTIVTRGRNIDTLMSKSVICRKVVMVYKPEKEFEFVGRFTGENTIDCEGPLRGKNKEVGLGVGVAIASENNLGFVKVNLLPKICTKVIKGLNDSSAVGPIIFIKEGEVISKKRGLSLGEEAGMVLANKVMKIWLNPIGFILIQGVNSIPSPPIEGSGIKKPSSPIPFHKPTNSRFQHLEISFISKNGTKILKKLVFNIMKEGTGRVMRRFLDTCQSRK